MNLSRPIFRPHISSNPVSQSIRPRTKVSIASCLMLCFCLGVPLAACAPQDQRQPAASRTESDPKTGSTAAQAGHSATSQPPAKGAKPAEAKSAEAPAGGQSKSGSWLSYYKVAVGAPIPMLPVPAEVSPLESNVWAVSPRISGRVDSLRVMMGQSVAQGQPVALIRSTDFADLWRDLKISQQQLTLRNQELKNAQTLSNAHAISAKDVKEAEESAREAELNHQAAVEKLNVLNVHAEGENAFWLTAPHSGVVVDVNVTAGQEVGPDSEPLVKIARLDQVLVTAQALESDVDGLRPGDYAQVTAAGRDNQAVRARILSISQAVDPDQHTVPVRLLVSPAPLWMRPNSYVQVAFNRQGGKTLLVPSEAVVTDDLTSIVFVKNPKTGKLDRRKVVLGKQSTDVTEITSGIHAGETIVSKGAILLLNEVNS